MIESLTKEQEEKMAEYRDKWIKIGLSTEPADKKEAEEGIRVAYKMAGLPQPKIVWAGSPFGNALTRAIVTKILTDKKIGASVRDSVWASVGASVRASVWASVWASVGASVGDSVWDSVRDSVSDSVWDSVRDSVRDSVWDSVRDSVRDSGYGQHDANWLAFYEYFKDVCDLSEETKKLVGLWKIAKSAGWYIPHEKICWVSERQSVLNRDEQGRLHSLSGPALSYPDGWSIYAVHGVRIPEYVIMRPEEITIKNITEESNTEIRRVMLDRFGWDRYLLESGAKPIDTSIRGTLYRAEIPDDEPLVMVRVTNSTPEPDGTFKDYFLRVPPTMKTADESVAWTFGLPVEEYAPAAES